MFSEIQAHRTIPKDLSVYSTEGPLASDATISDWLITVHFQSLHHILIQIFFALDAAPVCQD